MPSPTKTKNANPQCRLKSWCACLSITALPIYATTLFLIGRAATIDWTVLSSTATTHLLPLSSSIQTATATRPTLPLDRDIPLHEKSRQKNSQSYQSIAREIAAKWNLTSPEAPYLLEQQFYRTHDYNPRTDFLHFHHIPKTGGTTISDIINATLGSLIEGHRGILPGSERSGTYEPSKFYALTGVSPNQSDVTTMEFPYLASYAHTRLRPIHGPNKTRLASFFEEYFALPHNLPKRLRSLAMVREPMDLRASNHAMAMCALNGKVNHFNWQRRQKGLERICTPEQGLNISEFIDEMVDKTMLKCPKGMKKFDNRTKLDRYENILCRRGRKAMDFCRSPSHLLSSIQYKFGMRSMFGGLMGRFTAQEQIGMHDYTSVEEHLEKINLGFSLDKVEEYTLIDLGGLDSNIMHTAYDGYGKNHLSSSKSDGADTMNNVEPDFLWFGITERMKESTCLFYHTFNAKPLNETPRARVMNCSPTSWWTEEHRDEVKRKEPADYAVWRVANAILDARMVKMREDIHQKLENEQGLTRKVRDQYRAFVDAGCLESPITR